jgi:hypothetical protein
VVALLVVTVIKDDIETPGRGDDELLQGLVGVATAVGASRNVVEVEDPFDVEGNVSGAFDER